MDTATEADLFITINQKQKGVPKSVLVNLQSHLKWGSDEPKERLGALAALLAKTMNSDLSSPLRQRYIVEGIAPQPSQNLTIPETTKELVRSGLLGRALGKNYVQRPLCGQTDEETIVKARKVLSAYFSKLRDMNEDRWEAGRAAHICVNPGIRAHIRLLAEGIRYQTARIGLDPLITREDELVRVLSRLFISIGNFLSKVSRVLK